MRLQDQSGAGMSPRAGSKRRTERACRLQRHLYMRWLVPHLPGFYPPASSRGVRLSMTSARRDQAPGRRSRSGLGIVNSILERDHARAIRH